MRLCNDPAGCRLRARKLGICDVVSDGGIGTLLRILGMPAVLSLRVALAVDCEFSSVDRAKRGTLEAPVASMCARGKERWLVEVQACQRIRLCCLTALSEASAGDAKGLPGHNPSSACSDPFCAWSRCGGVVEQLFGLQLS